jgi:hypothetical protein
VSLPYPRLALVALAALVLPLAPAAARADAAARCKGTILKASAAFVKGKAQALQRCRERVVEGKLPPETDCENNLATIAAIDGKRQKLRTAIVRACGGGDKTCGTPDDLPLASIGWPGACPNMELGSCNQAIASCSDIAGCLECIGDQAVDGAIALAYDGFKLTDPETEKALNRCQVALGKESIRFLVAESKALTRCWAAVDRGKATAPCPDPGDGKALEAIERAASRKTAAICKACGGADGACDTPDDTPLAEIGFANDCSLYGPCPQPNETLADAVECLDCDMRFKGSCAAGSAFPASGSRFPCNEILVQTPPPEELDYTKDPNYGAASLAAAFVPDPYSVGMTAGGPVDVSYLGGSCVGFASAAPDFRIHYGVGGSSLLRLYFVAGSGDTTLIVNDPFGNFYCVDDSFGTVNPTIDFNNPAGGTYDFWVGSFASGTTVSGTFYATENNGNHP